MKSLPGGILVIKKAIQLYDDMPLKKDIILQTERVTVDVCAGI